MMDSDELVDDLSLQTQGQLVDQCQWLLISLTWLLLHADTCCEGSITVHYLQFCRTTQRSFPITHSRNEWEQSTVSFYTFIAFTFRQFHVRVFSMFKNPF